MDMQRRTMTMISKLYYEENMTQQQIAKQTGLSRMKVSRILQKAKEEGIVRIIIDYSGVYPELEQDIKGKYKLKDVVIVDTSIGNSSKEQVASAAAYYLERHLESGSDSRRRVGVHDVSGSRIIFRRWMIRSCCFHRSSEDTDRANWICTLRP